MLALLLSVWLNWLLSRTTRLAPATPAVGHDVGQQFILPPTGLFNMAIMHAGRVDARGRIADSSAPRALGGARGPHPSPSCCATRLPVITFAGTRPASHGGSILVETVRLPGIGRLAFDALLARDYQVLLGVFLCTSVLVVLFNLLTDLLYVLIDPRVQTP